MTTPAYPTYVRTRRWPPRNWYELQEEWSIRIVIDAPADYSDETISITKLPDGGCIISMHPPFGWNGATGVPDFKRCMPGTMPHDYIYSGEASRSICAEWGWSAAHVRQWADTVFDEINFLFGLWNPVRRLYFAGVRLLGKPIFAVTRWAAEWRDIWRAL